MSCSSARSDSGGIARRGVVEVPELEQDFGELEAPPPAHLLADGGRRGQLDALDGLECSNEIASRSEAPAPCDLEHVGDDFRPRLGRDLDDPVVDTRRHRVQARPGVVVRDVVRDEGVAAAARLVEGLVEQLEALGGAADVEQREGQPGLRPDPLEVGAGGLRHFDRFLRGLEAALSSELELVETRQPHVCHRELRRGARPARARVALLRTPRVPLRVCSAPTARARE